MLRFEQSAALLRWRCRSLSVLCFSRACKCMCSHTHILVVFSSARTRSIRWKRITAESTWHGRREAEIVLVVSPTRARVLQKRICVTRAPSAQPPADMCFWLRFPRHIFSSTSESWRATATQNESGARRRACPSESERKCVNFRGCFRYHGYAPDFGPCQRCGPQDDARHSDRLVHRREPLLLFLCVWPECENRFRTVPHVCQCARECVCVSVLSHPRTHTQIHVNYYRTTCDMCCCNLIILT